MKHKLLKGSVFAALLLLGLSACKKDPMEPIPNPVPPQQYLPNPLPSFALIKQLSWTELDYQTYSYNADHQLTRYYQQWQFVQGDPTQIHSIAYEFQYDATQKPVLMKYAGGGTVKYFYQGNLVEKTQEFASNGVMHNEITYEYESGRITGYYRKYFNGLGDPPTLYHYLFDYDEKGNLIKESVFEELPDHHIELRQTTEYSDFDNKINPTSWKLQYPFIPQVRWQFNNPRKVTVTLANDAPHIVTYGYEYNTQGLPQYETKSVNGGVLKAKYYY